MRSLKPILLVAALTISLMAMGTASADRSSGGGSHKGGYSGGGGYKGGYYHGGGHYKGYYRSSVGVVIGGPYWGAPWYYPYSYYPYYPYYPYYYPYYYPPAVIEPSSPTEYIERSRPEPSSMPSRVWFYCPDSKTYYPYVKECPSRWEMVPAEPSDKSGR
jgi:hypothetical protein